MRIVRKTEKLFDELERRELMPLRVKHGNQAFSPLPKEARTRFSNASAAREKKARLPKPRVTLNRVTRVQLICPDREFLDKLHRLLAEAKCPAELERKNLVLTYSKQYESARVRGHPAAENGVPDRNGGRFVERNLFRCPWLEV